MKIIARIHNAFDEKFGVPRQSGLADEMISTIVFEPEYRVEEALRGIEEFSHLWLIWAFDRAEREKWSPTVRPPRLGGNKRVGVFATRSPFRPNPIGLSCVRLEKVELSSPNGPVLHVSGADLMDGTPIYDIKPYIPYTDCQPDATAGFTGNVSMHSLNVIIPRELEVKIKPGTLDALRGILAQDPRPRYQDDPERLYGFDFDGYAVKFKVPDQDTLTVTEITRNK